MLARSYSIARPIVAGNQGLNTCGLVSQPASSQSAAHPRSKYMLNSCTEWYVAFKTWNNNKDFYIFIHQNELSEKQ